MEIGIVGQALAATGVTGATQVGSARSPASVRAMEQFAAVFGSGLGDDARTPAVDAAPASFWKERWSRPMRRRRWAARS